MSEIDLSGPTFELLFERSGLPVFNLPEPLAAAYGSDFGFESPRLYANFVASLDGVVGLQTAAESGTIISQNSEADRFVMGLLRACADAIVIGAGTFRKAPDHMWHPGAIHPPAATFYAEARRRLGLTPLPQLVVVSASGALDVTRPALRTAVIVTSVSGASKLRPQLPDTARLIVLDLHELRLGEVIGRLQREGYPRLLTEGGPLLFARLVSEQLVDELFLTSSPCLFGRAPNDQRKSLIDGLDVGGTQLELLSARRHDSHLFLRYGLVRPPTSRRSLSPSGLPASAPPPSRPAPKP
jgi:riboflavin biosynthesis pyrimidine reductase